MEIVPADSLLETTTPYELHQIHNTKLGTWAIFLLLMHFFVLHVIHTGTGSPSTGGTMLSYLWQVSLSWGNTGSPAATDQGSTEPAIQQLDPEQHRSVWGLISMVLLQPHGMSSPGLGLHPTLPQL